MIVRARAASLLGVEAQEVGVEVVRSAGLPGVHVVGLARGATKESWVRVRSALGQLGVSLSTLHLVVNLVPADRPKHASTLELALAVALLAAAGKLAPQALEGRRFWGEVGLDGRLLPSPGALLVADLARHQGERELVVPAADAADAARVPGVRVVGARDVGEVLRHLDGSAVLQPQRASAANGAGAAAAVEAACNAAGVPCLSEVVGQTRARRALEVAAAGGHNLLLVGPPGSGKTLLAHALRRLLPPLPPLAQAEVLRVQAAAAALGVRPGGGASGTPPAGCALPPFRSPHHASSAVALLGGGEQVRPGEVTLAHRGVLFLDELPEFARGALEGLREPLEEGCVHVARARCSTTYPARVLLVAAMNPCPCGHFVPGGGRQAGSTPCLCAFERVQRYRARVSGPLLERIDLHVPVQAVPFSTLSRAADHPAESSAVVRRRVVAARARQAARLGEGRTNSEMTPKELREHAPAVALGHRGVEAALRRGTLSMRALARLGRVARTFADLRGADGLTNDDVDEALGLVTGAFADG